MSVELGTTYCELGTRSNDELQLATFHVGEMLLGVDIAIVQEINRVSEITHVARAPKAVHGVINLRGDVVTVLDMRTIFGLPRLESRDACRILVIQSGGEQIGLMVDRVADILKIESDAIGPAPATVSYPEEKLISGVSVIPEGIVVILDVTQILEQTTD